MTKLDLKISQSSLTVIVLPGETVNQCFFLHKKRIRAELTGRVGAAAYRFPNFAELQPIHTYIYTLKIKNK